MNLTETAKILTMIQRIYPSKDKNAEEQDLELTAKLWQRIFQYEDYAEVYGALLNYFNLYKFAPTPSELKKELNKMKNPEMFISSEQAWEKVGKAIRKYGYYRQSEAFEVFDEKLKRVVKAIGWGTLCHSEQPGIVKSNFCKMWDNIQSTEQEELTLPMHRALHIMKKYGELNESNSKLPKV